MKYRVYVLVFSVLLFYLKISFLVFLSAKNCILKKLSLLKRLVHLFDFPCVTLRCLTMSAKIYIYICPYLRKESLKFGKFTVLWKMRFYFYFLGEESPKNPFRLLFYKKKDQVKKSKKKRKIWWKG